jgi:pilus assembly protein CpaB
MQKQWLILIIGVVLALAAVFMTMIYIDQQRKIDKARLQQQWEKMQANQTAVLIAKKDIPKGAPVDETMFETEVVLNKYVQPQAVTSMDRIAGMLTIAPISKGEQITLTKLTNVKTAGVLSEVTPVGKRAITISVDNISALAGMIKAGDYVDVIAMVPVPVNTPDGKQVVQPITTPLFQNVLVLAVGQETSTTPKQVSRYRKEAEEKKEVSPLITLALGPQEANLIAFVQEQGKIRLTLRSPADSKIEQTQPANWDTLFQYIAPKVSGKTEEEPKAIGYVDVYRGLTKEKVPLYK